MNDLSQPAPAALRTTTSRFRDRPEMTDPRDDAIRELINHNLAIRLQLAMLRTDAAFIPGPRIHLPGPRP